MEKIPVYRKAGQILRLRCPLCGEATVFYKMKYPVIGSPEMRESCPNCGYQFHRQPNYYQGVAYVSYGLAIVEGVIVFLLSKYLVFGLNTFQQVLVALIGMMLLAMWNYRLARVIWLNVYRD